MNKVIAKCIGFLVLGIALLIRYLKAPALHGPLIFVICFEIACAISIAYTILRYHKKDKKNSS